MQDAARQGGHPRQIDRVLAELDPEDARKLIEVYLPDRRYSSPQITRALAALGVTFSRAAIADWRAKHVPR
jgi:hypothetical protein